MARPPARQDGRHRGQNAVRMTRGALPLRPWLAPAPSLPDFRLEVYLGRLGVRRAPPPDRVGRRDAHRARGARAATTGSSSSRASRSATRRHGAPTSCARRSRRRTTRVAPEDVLGLRRRRGSDVLGDAGAGRARRPRRRHRARTTSRWRASRSPPARQSRASRSTRTRGWALDLDALEALLRPETRLVAVNFPEQPHGRAARRGDLGRRSSRCADDRAIRLFSDEVYRGLRAGRARSRSRRPPTCRPRRSRSASCPRSTACRGSASAGSPAATARCSSGWRRASTTRRSAARRRAS